MTEDTDHDSTYNDKDNEDGSLFSRRVSSSEELDEAYLLGEVLSETLPWEGPGEDILNQHWLV